MGKCSWTFPSAPTFPFNTVSTTGTAFSSPAPTASARRSSRASVWRHGRKEARHHRHPGTGTPPDQSRPRQQLQSPTKIAFPRTQQGIDNALLEAYLSSRKGPARPCVGMCAVLSRAGPIRGTGRGQDGPGSGWSGPLLSLLQTPLQFDVRGVCPIGQRNSVTGRLPASPKDNTPGVVSIPRDYPHLQYNHP
jgi:hypothetical protein